MDLRIPDMTSEGDSDDLEPSIMGPTGTLLSSYGCFHVHHSVSVLAAVVEGFSTYVILRRHCNVARALGTELQ